MFKPGQKVEIELIMHDMLLFLANESYDGISHKTVKDFLRDYYKRFGLELKEIE